MLVAYRLAGLSALEGYYAGDNAQAQSSVERASTFSPRRARPRGSDSASETARGRPWRGRPVITPAKARKAASGQIWGSWSDTRGPSGAAEHQPRRNRRLPPPHVRVGSAKAKTPTGSRIGPTLPGPATAQQSAVPFGNPAEPTQWMRWARCA